MIDSHFTDRCDVARSRWVQDSYGADIEAWPPSVPMHVSAVHCHYVTKAQRVGDTALAERPYVTTIQLFVPLHTDIRQGDRIYNVQFAGGDIDAGPFRVESIMRRRGIGVKHKTLLLERIGGG